MGHNILQGQATILLYIITTSSSANKEAGGKLEKHIFKSNFLKNFVDFFTFLDDLSGSVLLADKDPVMWSKASQRGGKENKVRWFYDL